MPFRAHRIRLERIRQAAESIDRVFLHSPQYACEPLGRDLGMQLWLKVETMNPIRCFKGRGADFLISQLQHANEVVTASAGNFGQAIAYACRRQGKRAIIFAATSANPLKVQRMIDLGATVMRAGEDFDGAKLAAKEYASVHALRFVEDGLDAETAEGAGTIALELLEAGPFDAVLVPLGNGALCTGVARVFRELSPSTEVIAVQAAGAPAMLESMQTGIVRSYSSIQTIADGIGVRVPIPEAVEDLQPLVHRGIFVDETEIIAAMRNLFQMAGVVAEPSAAVGVAALRKDGKHFEGKKVATILCGSNLTDEQVKKWLM